MATFKRWKKTRTGLGRYKETQDKKWRIYETFDGKYTVYMLGAVSFQPCYLPLSWPAKRHRNFETAVEEVKKHERLHERQRGKRKVGR